MRVYFLSEKTCALLVNGVYLGMADGFERTAEIDPADGVFCEMKPSGYLPVSFRFDEEFLFAPPPQIKLYFTPDAVAVYACDFLRQDQSLKVLWQKRLADTRFTLTVQGKVTLNMENETGFHLVSLPDAFESSAVKAHADGFVLECETAFALVGRDGTLLLLSEGRIVKTEPSLKAEIPFHDSLGHTAVCTYEGGKLTDCAIRSVREPTEATFALALFESALIGADCAPYLSGALRSKAGALKEFLGNFRSVVLTDRPDRVGLVFPRKERVYDVKYFRVETADGKVSNIRQE
ncbi:MAG: hypothetical protein HFE26_04880 [Clostridia bacterium]|nr:hypothetical protein [Clostridia bacterium]